jgi:hypothetical protein
MINQNNLDNLKEVKDLFRFMPIDAYYTKPAFELKNSQDKFYEVNNEDNREHIKTEPVILKEFNFKGNLVFSVEKHISLLINPEKLT